MEIHAVVGGLIGLGLGFGISRLLARAHSAALTQSYETLQSRQALLEAELKTLREQNAALLQSESSFRAKYESEQERTRELESTRRELSELQSERASLEAQREALTQQIQAQAAAVEKVQSEARMQFENLAHKILEEKSKTLDERSSKTLSQILEPMKGNLEKFEKKVQELYENEGRERFALKSEVGRLMELNQKMSEEASNLTKALKGDSKVQGDWGEYILENILQAAGLQEGREYVTQKEREGEDGASFKPDVVVQLPEDRHLIVDSKVSLKAYESYCSAADVESAEGKKSQKQLLDSHLASLEKHVSDLAQKHYQKLAGIRSPDFVFMFAPIEGAYLLAVRSDEGFAARAWKKGVAVVTATTLFTSLQTVASLWRLDHQNRNAQRIADEAGKLYDKFVGFIEDLEEIGKKLDSTQVVFKGAMSKLREGPGNVFRKVEQLKELGASAKKQIRSDYLEVQE